MNALGGAANAARLLAIFNPGRIYLVGFAGLTMWGTVRELLAQSRVHDGHTHDVIERVVSPEGNSTIDTINRLVIVKSREELRNGDRVWRWEDLGNLNAPHLKRAALLDIVRGIHEDTLNRPGFDGDSDH